MHRHPARTARLSLALASLASAGLGACSSQGSGTNPGESVLVAGAQHVVWNNLGGGFAIPIPAGASCSVKASYDFDLGAGTLGWNVCRITGNDYSNPDAYNTETGSRVLAPDERAQATAATREVTVSDRMTCGADKPTVTLEIVGTSGSALYGDDFYACEKLYAHYVDSGQLDQLGTLLDGMAHNL